MLPGEGMLLEQMFVLGVKMDAALPRVSLEGAVGGSGWAPAQALQGFGEKAGR